MCSVGRWTNFTYLQCWQTFQVTITILTDNLTNFTANSGKLTQFMEVRDIFTENGGNFERILSTTESLPNSTMNSDQLTQFANVQTILTASRQGIPVILTTTAWDSSDIGSNGRKTYMIPMTKHCVHNPKYSINIEARLKMTRDLGNDYSDNVTLWSSGRLCIEWLWWNILWQQKTCVSICDNPFSIILTLSHSLQ